MTSMVRIVLAISLLAGCGASGARGVVELEETRIVAHRTSGGELELDSYDASQLFARALELNRQNDCEGAVAIYDRIVSEFSTSRFVSPSLYNAGLCLQATEQLPRAVDHYALLLQRLPQSPDAKHARLQMTEALIELERWQDGLDSARLLLERNDLESHERLEAMARSAQAFLGLEQIEPAAETARDALTYYRTRQGDEVIADEYFAAAANFVLAETIRMRSESLRLPDADVQRQHEILDRRAQLLLDAQRAYFDTIRLTDARWAAQAGYRIGAMYEGLYRALVEAPVPPPSNALEGPALETYRQSYRSQLADRIKPLMRHAIRYWELTLLMVERTGVAPLEREWVERTRVELERARTLLLGASEGPTAATQQGAYPASRISLDSSGTAP